MKNSRNYVAVFLAAFAMLFVAACGGGGGGGSGGGTTGGGTVDLNGNLTAYLQQVAVAANTMEMAEILAIDVTMTGTLRVTDTADASFEDFFWSVRVEETGGVFTITSNKTIVLTPGTYDLALVISQGGQTYAGTATGASIGEGTNSINMTIRPVIGDTNTDVAVVALLPDFKFNYSQILTIPGPSLGVIIDNNGIELMFAANPDGTFDHMLLNFEPPGQTHTISMNLYSNGTLVGRSVVAQETLIAGQDLTMDLVALQGETQLVLDEQTGDATFNFTIPGEVISEVVGADTAAKLADLQVNYSITGAGNPLTEGMFCDDVGCDTTLTDNLDGTFGAGVTAGGYQFGNVVISVSFEEQSSGDLLGTCIVGNNPAAPVILNTAGSSPVCDLTLRKRAIIGGSLMAVVGINVFDTGNAPVAGAEVFANGALVGVTGSGAFGTPGYLKVLLRADTYTLRAEVIRDFGEVTPVVLAPLDLQNVDITLDQTMVARVAYFMDILPWFLNRTVESLTRLGIPYDVFGSPAMGVMDLSPYTKAITAGDQMTSFGQALSDNRAWFEAWTTAGGLLQMNLIDSGNAGRGNFGGMIMPGGFTITLDFFAGGLFVDVGHPVLNDPNPLDPIADFAHNSEAHDFLGVPAGANIIMRGCDDLACTIVGGPIAVDIPWGTGHILANSLTLEWLSNPLTSLDNFNWYAAGGFAP